MKQAMCEFFERLRQRWEAAGRGLPRAPWDPDVERWMWQSPPDDNEYAAWLPIEKAERDALSSLAPDLGPFHPSLDEYVNSFWFPRIDGQVGSYGVTLDGNLPGSGPRPLLSRARAYAQAHGGRLDRVPIGIEANGLLVVVDNRTGEVGIEDHERGTVERIATSLEDLFRRMP